MNTDDIKELIQTNYPASQLDTYSDNKDLFSLNINSNVDTIIERVNYPESEELYAEIAEVTQAS